MPPSDAEPLRAIIPCLDEEPAIGQLVAALRRKLDPGDRVIVVDNGSRDRTAEVASAAGAEVVSEPHRGYGRACLAGLRAARDGVAVFLDGDGADPPEDLVRVVAPIRAGAADLVVGSRRDREPGSMTAAQRFGNGVATGDGSGRVNTSRGNGVVRQAGFGDADAAPVTQTRPKAAEAPPKLVPPEILSKPTPAYTEEARRLRVEGEVLLEVVLQASGHVRVLRVVRGLGHGLDESAIRAAEQISFKPALRDGQPADSTAVLHIIFQLA